MIAKRRARKRSLIRSTALDTAKVGILSSLGGVANFQMGSSELDHASPDSAYAMPQLDFKKYLSQLSALHTAGILTDEEFSAASMRLIGS